MSLHSHQVELVNAVRSAFRKHRSVIMQLGTGGGKTHTAAEILRGAVSKGRRALFLAHLDSLIEDTHGRLTAAGIHAGFIQADRPTDPAAPVQVASLATLARRPTERPSADIVILDECHRAMAASVRDVLDAYPKSLLLGLTATPMRGDAKPLGDVFEAMVQGPSVRWLTANGYLVPADVLSPPDVVDQGLWLDPVDAYERYSPGSKAIVFASSVEHAEQVRAAFAARGHCSAIIVGDTKRDERARLRQDMIDGTLRVLVGVGVFIEGWDCPAVETVILARSLSVVGAYLQAIGRGLRVAPGKSKCTVLDLKGAVNMHGLPDEDRVWSLTGAACKRTETIQAMARCNECLAIFRPARVCPRCGAAKESHGRIPRNLNRQERLQRIGHLPQHEKDARYLRSLARVASVRMKMPPHRANLWAVDKFRKQFGREPEVANDTSRPTEVA